MAKKQIKKIEKKEPITPLLDKVLIREIANTEETKTKAGIILLQQEENKNSKIGEVLAVGDKVEAKVRAGDTVVFSWGEKFSVKGVEYYIVKETELIAIIN